MNYVNKAHPLIQKLVGEGWDATGVDLNLIPQSVTKEIDGYSVNIKCLDYMNFRIEVSQMDRWINHFFIYPNYIATLESLGINIINHNIKNMIDKLNSYN